MPRRYRFSAPDSLFHVMNRGVDRQDIFRNRNDRLIFIERLKELQSRFEVSILAYCLMSNHYHLVVHDQNEQLSNAMKLLNSRYAMSFNASHHRDGPLFRGRYKASHIDSERYLLQVLAYVHLNPVSANLVSHLQNYEWSSHSVYATDNSLAPQDWLNIDKTAEKLSLSSKASLSKTYLSAIDEALDLRTAAKIETALLDRQDLKLYGKTTQNLGVKSQFT